MKALAKKYATALHELTKDADEKQAKTVIKRFTDLLASRGHLALAPAVMEAYETLAKVAEGILTVHVASAAGLSNVLADEMRRSLEKKLGRKVDLEAETDPSLIGGAVIRYKDTLLDASVKRRLELLKQRLAA